MLYTSKAIVLKKVKYSENALIVHMFVRHSGHQIFMTSKGRGKNTKASVLFFPLSLLEITVIHKPKKAIQNINSIHLDLPFQSLLFNPHKSAIAQYLSEVFFECVKNEVQNTALFDFIKTSIEILDIIEHNISLFHIKTLFDLSMQMGFYPTNNYTESTPYFDVNDGTFKPTQSHKCSNKQLSEQVAEILSIKDLENHNTKTAFNFSELIDLQMSYYTTHLTGFKVPKSLEIFRMLL